MADIKIMVDSSADLSKELREEYGIGLIPLLSLFGEKSYVIEEELSNDEFYKMLNESGILPKTSQTPYATMYDILLKESREHETVIYFTLSSLASGQNHSAQLVRDDIIENDNPDANIIIVDTKSFSVLIGRSVIEAAKYVKEGKSPQEVVDLTLEYLSKWHAMLLVSDLTFLEKGGRMRKTTAVLGSLLDIKPVLTVSDGLIEVETKLRGKKKLAKKLCELVAEYDGFDESACEFIVAHSDKEAGDEMIETVKEEFDASNGIFVAEFGPLIGTNTGNGAFAVVFRTV
ncbi:MAG: DegV family protein [Clostridia bacterium]|nr:DegV family protein [Clostridia bacterium]